MVAVLCLFVPALSVQSGPAFAAWPHLPALNLPVSTAAGGQELPVIESDGAGGAIVAWIDSRSGNQDIYAQHILASGVVDPAWPANGSAVCTAAGDQSFAKITTDGAGGAIIVWHDLRAGGMEFDIFAQRVLASGVVDPAWPADGRALCPTAAFGQDTPVIVSDGAGGAIVAWQDFRSGVSTDIYAQRVLASGVVDPAWPVDGRALCTATSLQTGAAIVSDGAGGAVVAWQDFRGGVTSDIYAQRVRSSGVIETSWPADGRAVSTAANSQVAPALVADGSGGAIATWEDMRAGANDIYAHHILSGGVVDAGWPVDGRALCTAANSQQTPTIASDGAAGAIVTWQDGRAGTGADIYAQHVFTTGAVDPAWPVDGRALCTATDFQLIPRIVEDGAGGAIVAWQDARAGTVNYDIYAQHVTAAGTVDPVWPVDGQALGTASQQQQIPRIVGDGAGGAIVAWYDLRSGSTYDVYAQRVARFGYLGTPEAEIIAARDVPNDNGGTVRLSWNASWLDSNSDPNLAWYEIYRSVPPHYASKAVARGARLLRDFREAPATGSEAVVMGAAGYAWEYLTTQNALHYIPSYSYLAPTASDSTGYQNPRTAFMIVARNTSGSMYWLSRPDSGYSVDNLPPLAPAPFEGQYGGGVAQLHWRPNTEADLANYRLYRGTSSDFMPSPANLVATPADTLYDDPAGTLQYYKLSAVDIHGNESGYTTLLPTGTTDVPPAERLELALDPPTPNPALDRVALRYALPREASVRLAIHDPSGRMVRRLVDGVMPAGAHQQAWDLRDGAGHAVGAGLYFIRLEAEGLSLVRRMTAIR
jgi:hypothetical protein